MVIKHHLLKQVYQDLESLNKPRSLVNFSKDILDKGQYTSSQRKDLSTHFSRNIKDLNIKTYGRVLQDFRVPLSATTARLIREQEEWEAEEAQPSSSESDTSFPSPIAQASPPSTTVPAIAHTQTPPAVKKKMSAYIKKPPAYPPTPERKPAPAVVYSTPERLSHISPHKEGSPFHIRANELVDDTNIDLQEIGQWTDGSLNNPHIIFLSGDKQPQCKYGVKAVWADDYIVGTRACTVLILQAIAEPEDEDSWKLSVCSIIYTFVIFLLLTHTSDCPFTMIRFVMQAKKILKSLQSPA